MTFVCLAIVDRLGRKKLLITGLLGMSISSFSLAIFRILSEKVSHMLWVQIIFLIDFKI